VYVREKRKIDREKKDKSVKKKRKKDVNPDGPSDSSPSLASLTPVQRDYAERDELDGLTLDLQRLASFLTLFESATRDKLSRLNAKLARVESQLEYIEARCLTVKQGQN